MNYIKFIPGSRAVSKGTKRALLFAGNLIKKKSEGFGVYPMLIIFKVFLYVLLFLLGLAALLLIIPINYRGQVLTAQWAKDTA